MKLSEKTKNKPFNHDLANLGNKLETFNDEYSYAEKMCRLLDWRPELISFIGSAKPGRVYRAIPASAECLNSMAEYLNSYTRFTECTKKFRVKRKYKFKEEKALLCIEI